MVTIEALVEGQLRENPVPSIEQAAQMVYDSFTHDVPGCECVTCIKVDGQVRWKNTGLGSMAKLFLLMYPEGVEAQPKRVIGH